MRPLSEGASARRSSEARQAVPDSQEIVHRVWAALDDETGAPATTTYGR